MLPSIVIRLTAGQIRGGGEIGVIGQSECNVNNNSRSSASFNGLMQRTLPGLKIFIHGVSPVINMINEEKSCDTQFLHPF